MKPDHFPIMLSAGERIADEAALEKFLATNQARAQGRGYASKAARELLERFELTKKI